MSWKYSDADVADIVEEEGLCYAILAYTSADRIANPKLRAAWERAKSALKEVEALLEGAREVNGGCNGDDDEE